MEKYSTEQIRNVVLISHGGAGKTSLSEAMLFNTGAITRLGKVEEGTTTSDFDADEIKRHISISTAIIPCEWKEHKINVLDTPGYADFVGEVKAALRVADMAMVVVCAASGVEVGTEMTWKYVDERNIPRLVLFNKMDRDNADFFNTLRQVNDILSNKCVPIQLPIGSQSSFQGVVDLMSGKATGAKGEEIAVPSDMEATVAEYKEKLIESVAETNDDLLAKYLDGEPLSGEEIGTALREAVISGNLYPVVASSGSQNVCVSTLMDAIVKLGPSPLEARETEAKDPHNGEVKPLKADSSGPLAAFVFKTTADQYVGKLTYFRVFSGILTSDSHVWNQNKGKAERLGQLFIARGKSQEPVQQLIAGDIGAVAKLADTNTGDTLTVKEHPLVISTIELPEPLFSVAINPKTKADLDKMGAGLSRLVEEDPTLHVQRDHVTHETVLYGIGESHIDVAVEKLKRKFGVEVVVSVPKVAYKETITVPVKAEYKHKKQTGGHGQYGHVLLELQPLPRGTGLEFSEKVVGGSVPKNYIPAVEKGVLEAAQEGVLAHFPVVDVRAVLYDGSYHPVDSSDMSFHIAGLQAFKKATQDGQPVLLEPIMHVTVTVPEAYMGDTISDLNGKRAKVHGMNTMSGLSVVEAEAPLSEMLRYATDLRSFTQGRGTFTMDFSHYEPVPGHLVSKIVEQAKKEAVS